jgi:hypothetical protein
MLESQGLVQDERRPVFHRLKKKVAVVSDSEDPDATSTDDVEQQQVEHDQHQQQEIVTASTSHRRVRGNFAAASPSAPTTRHGRRPRLPNVAGKYFQCFLGCIWVQITLNGRSLYSDTK